MTRFGHEHSRTSTHNPAILPFYFPEAPGCILSSEHVERRLAAILAADVAGSCRLIGIDEEGTVTRLKALRRTLFDLKIAEHHGRVVKNTGDGAIAEFASVVQKRPLSEQGQFRRFGTTEWWARQGRPP